jgi:hypothetical protein
MRYLAEKLSDKVKGVDFTKPLGKVDAGTDINDDVLYYASSAFVPELHKAMRYLSVKSEDSILDYGAGKGGVMVQLSRYPFRKIAGIELSEKLVNISKANFAKLKLSELEIIHGDATTFTEIDDFDYFYFFNPFQGKTFEQVIGNIITSFETRPRRIGLVYYHPKCHHLIDKTGRFTLTKIFEDGPRRLYIYFNQ